ncbi:uncharacterized protein N7473_003923 [Penicillium subrubescens]|uniref:uncharacterized protein n=1 Tax=Penicillium subrubescens TaxID=1316194 RepID=UPI0025450116|nr:uncharacterized protein N7473_003923 [Penicillium subrubescens]KAJ5907007.1 hypothetical protein N7473_003923 [Penicillium subrubescens]
MAPERRDIRAILQPITSLEAIIDLIEKEIFDQKGDYQVPWRMGAEVHDAYNHYTNIKLDLEEQRGYFQNCNHLRGLSGLYTLPEEKNRSSSALTMGKQAI